MNGVSRLLEVMLPFPADTPDDEKRQYSVGYMREVHAALKASIEVLQMRDAAQTVYDTFKKDLEQGYRTRDKEYAVAILGKAFESLPPAWSSLETAPRDGTWIFHRIVRWIGDRRTYDYKVISWRRCWWNVGNCSHGDDEILGGEWQTLGEQLFLNERLDRRKDDPELASEKS